MCATNGGKLKIMVLRKVTIQSVAKIHLLLGSLSIWMNSEAMACSVIQLRSEFLPFQFVPLTGFSSIATTVEAHGYRSI